MLLFSIIEHESLKAEIILCPAEAYFFNPFEVTKNSTTLIRKDLQYAKDLKGAKMSFQCLLFNSN